MSIDYEDHLRTLSAGIEPRVVLRPGSIPIAASGLEAIDAKYGPDSLQPLSYHNAQHGLDHIARQQRLTNMLYPFMSPYYRRGIYDLNYVVGATHDVERDGQSVQNEQASVAFGTELLTQSGDKLLASARFLSRFDLAVMTTVVEFDENMRMTQPNLRTGSRDPIKFITAFADVNGIAMEGSATMLRDAINLAVEMNPDAGPKEIFDFLCGQAKYLRERLNDDQIKPDIAYFFPNHKDEVYAVMRKAFRPNILSAYGIANGIQARPELKEVIGRALQVAGKFPPGDYIGRAALDFLRTTDVVEP